MGNKLKILLIIAPVLLFSCSSEDNYDSNTRISKYNNKNTDVFSDQKYQEIYTNLYLRLALEKSLDEEDFITAICHEMVHVKQFARGETRDINIFTKAFIPHAYEGQVHFNSSKNAHVKNIKEKL